MFLCVVVYFVLKEKKQAEFSNSATNDEVGLCEANLLCRLQLLTLRLQGPKFHIGSSHILFSHRSEEEVLHRLSIPNPVSIAMTLSELVRPSQLEFSVVLRNQIWKNPYQRKGNSLQQAREEDAHPPSWFWGFSFNCHIHLHCSALLRSSSLLFLQVILCKITSVQSWSFSRTRSRAKSAVCLGQVNQHRDWLEFSHVWSTATVTLSLMPTTPPLVKLLSTNLTPVCQLPEIDIYRIRPQQHSPL